MEGKGGTAEKHGTRDRRVLAEGTVPENGQEGGEYIGSQLGSQGRLEEDLQ